MAEADLAEACVLALQGVLTPEAQAHWSKGHIQEQQCSASQPWTLSSAKAELLKELCSVGGLAMLVHVQACSC